MDLQPFTTMPPSLNAKTAVVVGGLHGIGLALAKYLADAGASVAIVDDVDDATMQDALEEITTPDHKVIAYQAPVNNVRDLETVTGQIAPQMGEVDIWVNSDAKDFYNQPSFIKALIPHMHEDAVIINFVPENLTHDINPLLVELAHSHHIGLHAISAFPFTEKGN